MPLVLFYSPQGPHKYNCEAWPKGQHLVDPKQTGTAMTPNFPEPVTRARWSVTYNLHIPFLQMLESHNKPQLGTQNFTAERLCFLFHLKCQHFSMLECRQMAARPIRQRDSNIIILYVRGLQLDWPSETAPQQNLLRDQEGCNESETTNKKLPLRRIHWCSDPSCISILASKTRQKMT